MLIFFEGIRIMRKFKKGALSLSLFLLIAIVANATQSDLELKSNFPETYTVKKGDTLWDISNIFLQEPWRWPEIWQNNVQINDPHLIFPGDELNLVYVDGRPQLLKTAKLVPARNDTLKLNPKIRATPLQSAIPAIPLDAISPFLSGNRVIDRQDLEAAPYILSGGE